MSKKSSAVAELIEGLLVGTSTRTTWGILNALIVSFFLKRMTYWKNYG